MQRLFFALWPTAGLAAALSDRASACAKQCGGRVMRQDTLHLTLAFLGDVASDRLAAVHALGDALFGAKTGMAAPQFVLDRLAYWPHNHIVWAGCRNVPAPLAALADALSAGLAGAADEIWPGGAAQGHAYPFVPHVSLLRHARQAPDEFLAPLAWNASEVLLVRSCAEQGRAVYQPLKRWPLEN